ncbi:extracellular solute-binding protein [Azospirillum sp.]|uniref:extracellular solute-binding protein n=1 Tax=Azospirillum sp. TaxID=34012 RepID=UPI003D7620AC
MRWTALALVFTVAGMAAGAQAAPQHAIALYGEPKYGPDFTHFDYVNPDAPKGGKVTLTSIGSFDTLNPYTIKGVPAAGLGLIYDTLMTSSSDEASVEYGLLAESIDVADDRSSVVFTLRPQARWHDGKPVTAEDVVFSFKTLTDAHPLYKSYYAPVAKVEAEGERTVRFTFKPGDNHELPMILGQLPVLPKHYWEGRTFSQATLEPPPGSGPYKIAAVDPGRSITYERVADYWGKDLAVNRGRYNFATMAFEYYRDATVALQGFRGGLADFRQENSAKAWATDYNFPAVKEGKVKVEEIPNKIPSGMQAFVFNTRRPVFADPKVRQAIGYAFDFEWANETLFYKAYKRTDSYFENSDLQAEGLPGPRELKLLEPLRDKVPPEVFTKRYEPPKTEGPQGIRKNLLEAKRLLDETDWAVKDGTRVNRKTGQSLAFEILLDSPTFERVALPFIENLKRLGVQASLRTVDTTQYENRTRDFDFDMVVNVWGQSLTPGNEQRDFWGSEAAGRPGSRNFAGIRNPAVDTLIEAIVRANTKEDLYAAVAALDRVLLWNHYVIPQWHFGAFRVAYWTRLKRPATVPPYGLSFDAWWVDAGAHAEGASGGVPR